MIDMSDVRKGTKFQVDGDPYIVVECQFVKPGKGAAVTKTRIKNLITGAVLDKTYRSNEKLEPADIEEREMQFLYREGENFVFMDNSNYEQVYVPADVVDESARYLADNMNAAVMMFNGRAVGVALPNFVELLITYCEPAVKGDTSSGATKSATLSTGHTINVPLFVEENTWIKIDTRNGEYVERVKK